MSILTTAAGWVAKEFLGFSLKTWLIIIAMAAYPACYLVGDYHGHAAQKDDYIKQAQKQSDLNTQEQKKEDKQATDTALKQETQLVKETTQLESQKTEILKKVEDAKSKIKQQSKVPETNVVTVVPSIISDDSRVRLNNLVDQANSSD